MLQALPRLSGPGVGHLAASRDCNGRDGAQCEALSIVWQVSPRDAHMTDVYWIATSGGADLLSTSAGAIDSTRFPKSSAREPTAASVGCAQREGPAASEHH